MKHIREGTTRSMIGFGHVQSRYMDISFKPIQKIDKVESKNKIINSDLLLCDVPRPYSSQTGKFVRAISPDKYNG